VPATLPVAEYSRWRARLPAGRLPLTLNLWAERGLDRFRKPEDRVIQASGEVSTWELRHQLTHVLLLVRLPFYWPEPYWARGCGGDAAALRQLGGYTALALYCFSPAVLKACIAPNSEILAALGSMGACIPASE